MRFNEETTEPRSGRALKAIMRSLENFPNTKKFNRVIDIIRFAFEKYNSGCHGKIEGQDTRL